MSDSSPDAAGRPHRITRLAAQSTVGRILNRGREAVVRGRDRFLSTLRGSRAHRWFDREPARSLVTIDPSSSVVCRLATLGMELLRDVSTRAGRLLWPLVRGSSALRFAYQRPVNSVSVLVAIFVFGQLLALAIAGRLTPSPPMRLLFLLALALVGMRVQFTHGLPARFVSSSTVELVAATVLSEPEQEPDE